MTTRNFVVKNGLTTGNITLDASTSNITANVVVANLSVPATANLGLVGNVKITGGTNGYVLSTDGAGNLSWVAQTGGGSVGGSNTQIQFNDAGTFGGSSGLTFNKTSTTLTANNFVATTTANLGAVGNVTITGGTNGQVLTTNGSGALSWSSVVSGGVSITVDDFTGNGVQTAFTLSTTPSSENYTIVSLGGTFQPRTTYTVSGATLTFSSAPPNSAPIEVTTFSAGGGSSGYTYSAVSANTTAAANTKYIVDTNTANLVITLPISPTLGDEVGIIDGTGNASVHAITVYGNGANIQGTSGNMTVTTNRAAFTLVYYNSTQGWILTNV